MNDRAIWNAILADIQHDVPGFRVVDKSKSTFMRIIGAVLGLFMDFDQFETTIGKTAYMTPDTIARYGWVSLAHEGVHARDSYGRQVSYALRYLTPQAIAAVAFLWGLGLGVAGILGASWSWWYLLGFAPLLALIPWPSRGRVAIERRAYLMTMVGHVLRHGPTGWVGTDAWLKWFGDIYTGGNYYWMSWDRPAVDVMVLADMKRARQLCSGLVTEEPYSRTVALVLAADRIAS